MRRIGIVFLVSFSVFFNQKIQAQEKTDLTYFYVNDLTVESYGKWFKTMEKKIQLKLDYACIPAKIIGVKKEDVVLLKSKLSATYKVIKEIKLTQEEAEQKCATQRSF